LLGRGNSGVVKQGGVGVVSNRGERERKVRVRQGLQKEGVPATCGRKKK